MLCRLNNKYENDVKSIYEEFMEGLLAFLMQVKRTTERSNDGRNE